jgi:putative Holliday junction resolvase
VAVIVVGVALDQEGRLGPQGRKCQRLAHAIEERFEFEVRTWDETGTTEEAASLNASSDLDARAAALLLQDFLDAQEKG